MSNFVDSATSSYLLLPDGEDVGDASRAGMMINWPVDITQDNEMIILKQHNLIQMPIL